MGWQRPQGSESPHTVDIRALFFVSLPGIPVAEILSREPQTLVAGDSWRWDTSWADYSAADGWVLSYVLLGASAFPIAGAGMITAVGDGWAVRVAAAATADLAAGSYWLVGYVTLGADRFEVYRDRVTITANFAALQDGRSSTERELAIVDAAISGRLTADLQSYQVQGRAVNKIPIEELHRIRGFLRSQVWRERHPGQLGPTVQVRFGRPA